MISLLKAMRSIARDRCINQVANMLTINRTLTFTMIFGQIYIHETRLSLVIWIECGSKTARDILSATLEYTDIVVYFVNELQMGSIQKN